MSANHPSGTLTLRDSLVGLTIAVTGASSGIGYFVAEELARRGAQVVLVVRSEARGRAVRDMLAGPGHHDVVLMDLAEPASVQHAGASLGALPRLDALVLNAGVIDAPSRWTPGPYGVECTVAVNALAHLELMGLAMPALRRTPAARVVSTGSVLTQRIPFAPDDWTSQRSYEPRVAYAMSRHVAEILGVELDRRLAAGGSGVTSAVTHPGSAIDALTPDRPGVHRRSPLVRATAGALRPLVARLVHGKHLAARPAVAAVAATTLPRGAYIAPHRNLTGDPVLARPVPTTTDPALGARLWDEAETLLGHPVLV